MAPLHVILASMGTDGDVIPYIALGRALRGRGHRVTLAASENYRASALASGLAFVPLFTAAENDALFANPDFWHPLKGPAVGARWGVKFLPRQYDLFAALAAEGRPVLVASPALLAARLVQEKLNVPMATVVLQPWMIPSSIAPPVMTASPTLPRWAPRPIGALYWRMFDVVVAMLMGKELNALRERLGLKPLRRVLQWWFSPQRVIGMFPDWYGPPQTDWPQQVRLVGFPMYDGHDDPLAEDVLAFCRAGPPPIAVTFGSGMMHAADRFKAAADACARLNARGIFLTKFPEQVPAGLPDSIRVIKFAPFQKLFPHCSAIVHHGGIGTLAKSLAAGLPQLIIPIAWDQTDNAVRVQRLGAGDWLRGRHATGAGMARALAKLVNGNARSSVVQHINSISDPMEVAAREVEALA